MVTSTESQPGHHTYLLKISKIFRNFATHIARRGPMWVTGRDAVNGFALADILMKSVYSALFLDLLKLRNFQSSSGMGQWWMAYVDMYFILYRWCEKHRDGLLYIFAWDLCTVARSNEDGQCEGLSKWERATSTALTLFLFTNVAKWALWHCVEWTRKFQTQFICNRILKKNTSFGIHQNLKNVNLLKISLLNLLTTI